MHVGVLYEEKGKARNIIIKLAPIVIQGRHAITNESIRLLSKVNLRLKHQKLQQPRLPYYVLFRNSVFQSIFQNYMYPTHLNFPPWKTAL